METIYRITVNSHYSFVITPEDRAETEATYKIKITDAPNGDFIVTGTMDALDSFTDDITIGDEESSGEMMDTAEPVG